MSFTRVVVILAFLSMCSLATAKKYWDPPAGQGVSTVGTGGDYATLLAAAADYNTSATTGPWTIEIVSNLTEAANIAFSRANPTHPVTIKPAAATSPVVTFTKTTDNTGPTGHIVIGSTNTAWAPVTCNNFTIDGSNNGTSSRDLTFVGATGNFGRIVNLTGNSANFVIKNCNLNSPATYTISFTIRNASGVNYAPIDPTVENCLWSATPLAQQGVAVTNSGTIGAYAPRNVKTVTVRNCTINASLRGIFLNYGGGADIQGNTINITGTTATDGVCFYGYITNDPTATNVLYSVYGNKLSIVSPRNSATNGDYAIRIDYPSYLKSYNNTIYVQQTGAAGSLTNSCRGYYLRAWEANAEIYNNSINLYSANQYYLTGGVNPVNPSYVAGICVFRDSYQGTCIARNNVIRVDHKGGGCVDLDYQTDATGSATLDNNDYYAAAGCFIGSKGTGTIAAAVYTPYATLTDWQTATGKDASTLNMDPLPVWVSSTDLHFNGSPGAAWKFGSDVSPLLSGALAADIDGQNRDVIQPYVGADEPIAPDTTLTVASAYGSPVPAVGVNNTTSGTNVNASVASPVAIAAGTQVQVTGYTGTGDAPTGAGASVSFTIANPSTLTWNWGAIQYQLSATASPAIGGTISGGADGTYYDTGTILGLQANPNSGWFFTGWSGDLTGTTNPQNLTMGAPKSVTAAFINQDIDTTTTLAFGNTEVNTTVTLQLVVNNLGDTPLTISALNITGPDASAFLATASLPLVIAGGANDTIDVRFNPIAVAPYSATLVITSDDPDEPTFNVALTGNGLVGAPQATPSTSLVDFGIVNKGTPQDLSFTITNTGIVNLSVSALGISGPDAGAFQIISPIGPFVIAAGLSQTVIVRFSPALNVPYNAQVDITSNDPASPAVVGLTGVGAPPTAVDDWRMF